MQKPQPAVGTLTSPQFEIDFDQIEFLIGGGSDETTCLNLMVDGKVVLSTTGSKSRSLEPVVWNVKKFQGKQAKIQAVDNASGRWGSISFDDIQFVRFNSKPEPFPGDQTVGCGTSGAQQIGSD